MKLTSLIGVGLLVGVATAALAQPSVNGKHASLDCAACHGQASPASRAPTSSCINCHGDNAAVATKTANVKPNPHASHEGDLRCTKCHRVHSESVIYCNECHQFSFKLK